MLTKVPKPRLIITSVLCFGIIIGVLLIGRTMTECERLRRVPEAPIYPQSVLLRTWNPYETNNDYSLLLAILGGRYQANVITSEYEIDAPIETIRAFYENYAQCTEFKEAESIRCIGKTNDFGEFHAYINTASNEKPSFTIEFRWWSCSKYL